MRTSGVFHSLATVEPWNPPILNNDGMPLPIRAIPATERPRERLLRDGPSGLSDAELVAILLGSGTRGSNAIDTAQSLLAQWGGPVGLAGARPVELARQAGVGPAKAARVVAAFALGSRFSAPRNSCRLTTSAEIATIAQTLIGRERAERILVLVADGRLRLIHTEVVAAGKAQGCPVPIREVLATVLRYDGSAFAVAHNHPSGAPTPSAADRAVTRHLREAASHVGLRFLDHVVVTTTEWRSITASS